MQTSELATMHSGSVIGTVARIRGHADGQVQLLARDIDGRTSLDVPTGDELNRRAWESARERNLPSELESYRQGYRSGFEQGYKDAARPAF